MEITNLEIGGIYKLDWNDDRLNRVIGLDDIEVHYDYFRHDNKWSFTGAIKSKCCFYRTSSKLFAKKATLVDFLPLSEHEKNVFRPDLQIRFGRTMKLNWNNFKSLDYEDFQSYAHQNLDADIFDKRLQINKIVLLPYGYKGATKKGAIIEADNGSEFEITELIWKAKQIQEAINDQESNGIE